MGRKIYHLAGGLGLLSLYYILGRDHALVSYCVLFAIVMTLDVVRLSVPAVNRFVFDRFGSFIRTGERHRLTGTPPYVLGLAFTLFAYSTPVAATAICFLACGDVAATAVGERFGRTRIGSKSLEGTAGFIAAALASGVVLLLLGMGTGFWIMVLGALVAAGIELLPLPVNDNLLIPVLSGGCMEAVIRFLDGMS